VAKARTKAPTAEMLEVERRVEEIYRMLLAGATRSDIILYSTNPNSTSLTNNPPWGVCDRQIDKYIARAHAKFNKVVERRNSRLFNVHYARREDLYAKALNQGNIPAAHGVLKDCDTWLGLYPTQLTQERVSKLLTQFMGISIRHIDADKLPLFYAEMELVLCQADPDGKFIPRSTGTASGPATHPPGADPEDYSSDLDLDSETLDPAQPPRPDGGPVGDGAAS
jgi:hypothetical protein